jgi:hypothetical protein
MTLPTRKSTSCGEDMLKEAEFFISDSITPLEEPFTNDETLLITDTIAEEQLENAPETIEDLNDSSVDLAIG